MRNYRVYGEKPYKVIVVHGGPGAPGSLGYVAKVLSEKQSILEPFQSASSVNGQVNELHEFILENCSQDKIKIVGHSWGAWLAYMYAAAHPDKVEKLILIAAGSFDERYNFNLTKLRLSRLTETDRHEAEDIISWMHKHESLDIEKQKRFSEIMERSDLYDIEPVDDGEIEFQPEVFQSIWTEADKLRRYGELMEFGRKIKCPVLAIHGNYDTRPAKGVEEPLSKILKKFKFISLDQCGHYPWKEKFAKNRFFEILETELA
jgi:pimeloyl-ACP methyl ester carboxylesterase